jgi:hypothetical protein
VPHFWNDFQLVCCYRKLTAPISKSRHGAEMVITYTNTVYF